MGEKAGRVHKQRAGMALGHAWVRGAQQHSGAGRRLEAYQDVVSFNHQTPTLSPFLPPRPSPAASPRAVWATPSLCVHPVLLSHS